MAPDAPTEVSSTSDTTSTLTPVQTAVVANDFAAFERAERTAVSSPGKQDATPAAASSPAEPVEQVASTDASPKPASEPATGKGAKARTVALDGEIAELHEKLRIRAALRDELARTPAPTTPDATPAASSPAPAAALADPRDPEPNPDDTATYPEGQFDRKFLRDQSRWAARAELRAAQAADAARETTERDTAARQQAVREHDARVATFSERCDTAMAADATLTDRIDSRLLTLEPSIALKPGQAPTFGNVVADVLLQSDHPVGLMLHLSNHAEADRLSKLAPDAFYREIGRIEATLDTSAAPPAVPRKTVTEAPAPPPTLGRKSADAGDPLRTAVASNDFAAFERAEFARLAAARR